MTENLPQTSNLNLVPSNHEFSVFESMATRAVDSKLYRGIGDKSGVMIIMLAARELGIPPMQALNGGLNIIQGKVEISAKMMNGLIRKAGHKIKVKDESDSHCTLIGTRGDTGETETVSFSIEDAKTAGIYKAGGGWSKWPKDMCYARALSRLARRLFSDVIGMGYIEGEISNAEVQVIDTVELACEEVKTDPIEQVATMNSYFNLFRLDDQAKAGEYLNMVCNHFDWPTLKAVEELMKDPNNLIEKFNKWKNVNA